MSLSHLSVHEEAQCECDSHGPVSKLLLTAHGGGGGGGVVGGGVGGLCRWETHEGPRPRGVRSLPEHHREPFREPGESPGAVRGMRGGRFGDRRWDVRGAGGRDRVQLCPVSLDSVGKRKFKTLL